jgi:hypothetical protein
MGRSVMYSVIGCLAVFVLMVTFATEQGNGSIAAISQVNVHDLRTNPLSYTGKDVTTTGTLAYSAEQQVFHLVEGDLSVAIRGYAGSLTLRDEVGKRVAVSGKAGIDPDIGVYLEVADLRIVN